MRRAAGLTQRELSRRLRRDHSVITRLEQGQRRIDCLELYFICKACGESAEKKAAELMREIAALDRNSRKGTKKRKRTR